MKKPTLTPLQRKAFFMGLRPAALEAGEDPEIYRKRILREELGVEHMSEVDRGSGFDKLMSRIWQDRGDYERASEYARGSFSRLKHLIVGAAQKIVERKPDYHGSAFDYIVGTMFQAKMLDHEPNVFDSERLARDANWMKFSEQQLKHLLMMLNAHLGRLRGKEVA